MEEEVVKWLHKRIEKLEEELDQLYALQALLERDVLAEWPGEVVLDEVKIGGKLVGKVIRGDDYVRVILLEPLELSPDVKEYLMIVEEALRRRQRGFKEGAEEALRIAKEKRDAIQAKVAAIQKKLEEEKLARLTIREDGMEIRYDNVYSASLRLDAEHALKEAVRLNYLLKLLEHNEQPPEQQEEEQQEEQGEDSNGQP